MDRLFCCFLLLALVGCNDQNLGSATSSDDGSDAFQATRQHHIGPVAANQGRDVANGFRGQVHPLLHGHTQLAVTAHWSPVGTGRGLDIHYLPEKLYTPFRDLTVANPRHVYSERDFSAFLPEQLGTVGQIWAVDLDTMARFLKQFHPNVLMHLVTPSRHKGHDGAFAVLRAMSPTYLEVLLRVHAEFNLEPGVFFTPGYFSGRLLVNRETGTVEHFQLSLPKDNALNATLTSMVSTEGMLDMVQVDRMELTGGNNQLVDEIGWVDAIALDEAQHKLKKIFYKHMDIDWVPVEQAVAVARKRNKPILAIVLWGAFDDQSC